MMNGLMQQWRGVISGGVMVLTLGAALVTGCTVDTELVNQVDKFPCQTNADCLGPAFICDPNTSLCVRDTGPIAIDCIDEDDDGYGANPDGERERCDFAEQDPDDADDTIYPGAPELCDGKDNDNDGSTDAPRACEDLSQCNREEAPPTGTFFQCENSVCVLKPSNQSTETCQNLTVQCVSGAYEALPDECKL